MRYSKIEDGRTSDKNYENIKDEEIDFVEADEEITEKIPTEKFCQINNTPLIFDDPAALVHIILLKAKPNYISYYGSIVYAVIIKSENDDCWLGIPAKNPQVGLIKWNKFHFEKIYGFNVALSLIEEI
jgi:hypothetical protein